MIYSEDIKDAAYISNETRVNFEKTARGQELLKHINLTIEEARKSGLFRVSLTTQNNNETFYTYKVLRSKGYSVDYNGCHVMIEWFDN